MSTTSASRRCIRATPAAFCAMCWQRRAPSAPTWCCSPATWQNPLRPSWLLSDAMIAATGADYLALGHWDRAAQVGCGAVPAYYSGSPDYVHTVNLVRLLLSGDVVVSREPVRRDI